MHVGHQASFVTTNPISLCSLYKLSLTLSDGERFLATPQLDVATKLANTARAVSVPLVFGDERDAVLAKWNQLQAFWGTGKGYYTQQGNSVDFTPENLFCRFKVRLLIGRLTLFTGEITGLFYILALYVVKVLSKIATKNSEGKCCNCLPSMITIQCLNHRFPLIFSI